MNESSTSSGHAVLGHPRAFGAIALGLAIVIVTAAAVVSPALAANAGLSLTWNECPEGGGQQLQTFACAISLGAAQLAPTLRLSAPVDSVVAMETVVDLVAESATLPDWWQLGPGGCRAGSLSGSADFSNGLGACMDPWNGEGIGIVQIFAPTQPRGGANQARIVLSASVPASAMASLGAGNPYYAGLIRIAYLKSAGVGACPGCIGAVCLVLNSVRLVRFPGATPPEVELQPDSPGTGITASWQGSGADCQLVPVRNRTWGAVKSLYR